MQLYNRLDIYIEDGYFFGWIRDNLYTQTTLPEVKQAIKALGESMLFLGDFEWKEFLPKPPSNTDPLGQNGCIAFRAPIKG